MRRLLMLLGGMLLVGSPVVAQVRCTMPNGVVIEQRLSQACPQGAVKSETLDGAPAPTRAQPTVPPQPLRRGGEGRVVQTVFAEEFGPAWPLTFETGELRCVSPVPGRADLHALLFVNSGQVYALNGIASSHAGARGWKDIATIWRSNPAIEGTKVPITPLIERATRLCDAAVPSSLASPQPADSVTAVAVPESGSSAGFPFIAFLVIVGGLAALVMAMRGSAGVSGPAMYCTTCGHEGPAKTVTRGSIAVEIILWICFLLPGLVYSVWRLSSKYKACTSCGSRTLVPTGSPVAIAAKKRLAQ